MNTIVFVLNWTLQHPIETIGFLAFVTWVWRSAAHPDLG
jgi:hypothetical protein